MDSIKEIAVFGGTFDPPTKAHEAIIGACLEQPHIDEVWVMPSGQRHDKPHMSSVQTRLELVHAMTDTAFRDTVVKVSDVELRLPQPTCTAVTYEALQQNCPDARFWFVFGADSYHDMPNWEYGEYLQRTMAMLLIDRTGFTLPRESTSIRHLPIPVFEPVISSSLVRQCVQEGVAIEDYVHPAVSAHIRQAALYT